MSAAESWLLLFTRCYRPQYKRDILNVCCTPHGFRIDFGYRKQHVSDEVWNDQAHLKGRRALILFCEPRQVGSASALQFHPIRTARIGLPRREHEALTIPLILGHFYNYGRYQPDVRRKLESERSEGKLDDLTNLFLKEFDPPRPKSGGKYATYAIQDLLPELDAPGTFTDRWQSLVEHVHRLADLSDCEFLWLEGSDTKASPGLFLQPSEETSQEYVVPAGSTQRVRATVLPGSESVGRRPEIEVTGEVAVVGGPMLRQHSSGLDAEFVIRFKRSFEDDRGLLRLWVNPAASSLSQTASSASGGAVSAINAALAGVCSPEFVASVRIKPPKTAFAVAVLLVALGTLITGIGADIPKEWGGAYASHALSYAFAAKTLGALMLAVGAVIGFRKLPLKG